MYDPTTSTIRSVMDGHCLSADGGHLDVSPCLPNALTQTFDIIPYTSAATSASTGPGSPTKSKCTGYMCENFDPLFNKPPPAPPAPSYTVHNQGRCVDNNVEPGPPPPPPPNPGPGGPSVSRVCVCFGVCGCAGRRYARRRCAGSCCFACCSRCAGSCCFACCSWCACCSCSCYLRLCVLRMSMCACEVCVLSPEGYRLHSCSSGW